MTFDEYRASFQYTEYPQVFGLMDKNFAKLLGVKKQYWSDIKHGRVKLTDARKQYLDALLFMSYNGGLNDFLKYKKILDADGKQL
jgi:predicted transcriptional regulator